MSQVQLNKFNNSWYNPGSNTKKILWYFTNIIIFKSSIPFPNKFKSKILSIFGAKVGKEIVIKPCVNIKYPWLLDIGDYCWIGENVWIDNLDKIEIGNNVCISQGAFLFCGNHNYKKVTFDLIIKPIIIEDGAWIGAKSIICPGVKISTHSIITAGSVLNNDTDPYMIYQGNPAVYIRERSFNDL